MSIGWQLGRSERVRRPNRWLHASEPPSSVIRGLPAMPTDFKAHLARQLGFLKRSCDAYDHGHFDEGARIAVVARVIFHQTRSSTSLLTHLGNPPLTILSTTRGLPRIPGPPLHFNGLCTLTTGVSGAGVRPKLGGGPTSDFRDVADWWKQVVFVIDRTPISRHDLVLGGANKDGGAHVDPELSHEYELLMQDGAAGELVYKNNAGEEHKEPITDAHFMCLRQIGYEILNSPDLTTLSA